MKSHTFLVLVPSLIIGAIVIISTDCNTPAQNAPSGQNVTPGTFSIANEYIDFHGWYGEITWSGAATLNPALIVVSTSSKARNWDGNAVLSEQGELTAAGITDVSVDAIYSRKFDSAALKTRKVFISVNDLYADSKFDALRSNSYYNIAAAADYAQAPWLIKANTEYHMHYYTEGGAQKTYTHAFKTPDYPSSAEQADNLFAGGNWLSSGDGVHEPKFFNLEGAPGTVEIKRNLASSASSFEPFVFSRVSYYLTGPNAGKTIFFTDENSNTLGSCLASGTCGTIITTILLFTFTDHSSAYQRAGEIPSDSFGVVDFIFFAKSITSGKDKNTSDINADGSYSFSWDVSASKLIKIQSITE